MRNIVPDVLPGYFVSIMKGVVNMARFQLLHVRLEIYMVIYRMRDVSDIIVPGQILFKVSIASLFLPARRAAYFRRQ